MTGKEKESTEDRLRALAKRLEELEIRLSKESSVLDEVLREVRLMRDISLASASILRTTSRITRYNYGDISRHIVDALLRSGPMNISQLTIFLMKTRGTASRRIVSEKVKLLRKHEIIEEIPGKKSEKRYKIKERSKS